MKEENFCKVPKSLMRAKGYYSKADGKPVPLNSTDKIVYIYMLDRLGFFVGQQKGQHFESQQTIATACGLEVKAVGRILRSFHGHGILEAKKQSPSDKGNWRWYYKSIVKDVDFWVGSVDKPEKLTKTFSDKPTLPSQATQNTNWFNEEDPF